MTRKRLFLTVYGDVQGVGFRWHTMKKAADLRLTGWVRNELDGSVSIAAAGDEDKLLELRAWALRGPRPARVERIEERWEDVPPLAPGADPAETEDQPESDFRIKYY